MYILLLLHCFISCVDCKLDVLGALQGSQRHSFSSSRMSVASWEEQDKRSRRKKVRGFIFMAISWLSQGLSFRLA